MGNNLNKHYKQNELQSVEQEDGSRRSPYYIDENPASYHYPDASTVYEAFQRGQRLSIEGNVLGRRSSPGEPYEWLTYSEVSEMANAFGSGLVSECNLKPSNDTFVGLFSQNRVEWIVADQACVRFSMVCVPLYITLGNEAMIHIIEEAGLSVVIVDTPDKIDQLISISDDISCLKYIVLMDGDVHEETRSKLDSLDWRVFSFFDLLESGRASPRELNPAGPEDIYTICYTSGTTGKPKGVVVTHRSILITSYSGDKPLKDAGLGVSPNDIGFSYLPLAHLYERMTMTVFFVSGAKAAFFSGDLLRLLDDIQAVQPTIFSAVPRVLQRMYDKIYSTVGQSTPKKTIFNWAVKSKMNDLKLGILNDDTIWDKLVFKKIKSMFGGRLRHINCGSAAISPVVLNFFRVALNITVYSGYGQTETGGVASLSAPFDFRGDHVGGPIPCATIKLIDVPELGYFKDKGYGEILFKAPTNMKEYYRMPEKTKETLDEEGWLHTGDIGTWTCQGNLQIVDRCKQIFKLSQGEYIAPDKVEGVYRECPHVGQIYIDGRSDQSFLVAIVVPDFEVVANTLKVAEVDPEEVCRNSMIREIVLNELNTVGRSKGLKGFEIVRRVHLHPTLFTSENGLLTVTFKSRRHELKKKFTDQVDAMYNDIM